VALTIEAAAMAGVPLAGTNWIPGRNGGIEPPKPSKKDRGVTKWRKTLPSGPRKRASSIS
jgi:hypothetical protein